MTATVVVFTITEEYVYNAAGLNRFYKRKLSVTFRKIKEKQNWLAVIVYSIIIMTADDKL